MLYSDIHLQELNFFMKYFDSDWDQWVDLTASFTLERKMKIEVVHEDGGAQAGSSSKDSSGLAAKQKLSAVMENLKGTLKKPKQGSDDQERKKKPEIKIQLGWHNFKKQTKSYSQVKSNTGGGVVTVLIPRTSTYKDLQKKAVETFFPLGKSCHLGYSDSYDFYIGNSRGESYDTPTFSVEKIFQEGGSRARIYLFSRLKTESNMNESESSSDDSDLMDPFAASEVVGTSSSTLTQKMSEDLEQSSTLMQYSPSTPTDISQPSSSSASMPMTYRDKLPSPGTPSVTFNPSLLMKSNQCGICADKARDAFFIPCGHSICSSCAVILKDGIDGCPYCKCSVEKIGKLFD